MSGFVVVAPNQDRVGDAQRMCTDVWQGLSGVGSHDGWRLPGYAAAQVIAVLETTRDKRHVAGVDLQPHDAQYPNFIDAGACSIAWSGNPMWRGAKLTPQSLCGAMDSEAGLIRWALELRGQFQILLHHKPSNQFALVADRLSTIPAYYTYHHGLVISPEPLALAQLAVHGWKPNVRTGAIYEYLATGHLLEDGCWWDEVRRLGPGHILWIEQDCARCFPYWEMRPEPDGKSTAEYTAELQAAIDRDCQMIPSGKAILTLSGGYDSRALLGMLHRDQRDFEAVSYSFSDEYSAACDKSVGTYFARKLGVRHTSYVVEPPSVERICDQMWTTIAATGGECDVVVTQDAFLGPAFYNDLAGRFDFMLRGDECWGWGDFVVTPKVALWQVMLLQLDQFAAPGRILTKTGLSEGCDYLRSTYAALLSKAPSRWHPNNAKDFWYWRHREARLLQNMAQFRRKYLPHYAPFLFGHALDVVRRLPVSLRCRKALFRRTMERQFPDLFHDDKMPTTLTPRVSRFERLIGTPEFQQFVRELLVERPPAGLGERLDGHGLECWLSGMIAPREGKSASARKLDLRRGAYEVLRKNRYVLAAVAATLAATNRLKGPVVDSGFLFRVICLAMTLRTYEARLSSACQATQEVAYSPGPAA